MDACDPGLDIRNLRSLVKQNTGTDLKLSKAQICEVYSYIQGGKLPLPPLILSKDGSYLIDSKSPLTRKDYDTLFKSTSKVDELRKIAKKVGVIRYANKKFTKQQLIDIIGRRLHGLKVYEPIKLRSVQKKQIENFNNNINAFNENANTNNVNNLNSLNNVNNLNSLNNVNNVNGANNLNNVNNVNRLNNVNRGGNNLNRVNNVNRLNSVNRGGNRVNTVNRLNSVNRGGNLNVLNRTNFKAKNQVRPRFLNVNHRKVPTVTSTNIATTNYKAFTMKKSNKPAFLNKNFIKTNKFISKPGYVFKRGNKGLGMYKNKPPVQGPVGPPTPAPAPTPTPTPTPTPAPVPNVPNVPKKPNVPNVPKKPNVPNVPKKPNVPNVPNVPKKPNVPNVPNNKKEEEAKIKAQQKRLLNKILNNSKNFTNVNKAAFLKRYNNGENFNTIKTNAIRKAQELAKQRKNKNEENRLAREKAEENRIAKEEANRKAKEEANRKAKEEANLKNKQQRLLSKILNNSKNLTNANKVSFLKRFNNGENFNTVKTNAIRKAQELAKKREKQEQENSKKAWIKAQKEKKEREDKIKEQQKKLLSKILKNSKNLTNANKVAFLKRFNNGENFNTIKTNAIRKAQELAKQRKNKEEEDRKAREKAEENNRKAKEEANKKAKEAKLKEQQKRLLSKILNNSKNLTNADKVSFLKRYNKGENFNTIKTNAIRKAQELAKKRKNKEEADRKAKEKEEADRKAKEEANKKAKEAKLKEQQKRLLSKILNNSKNLSNADKVSFLKRYNRGENFTTIKSNAIRKAQELAKQRKNKEEADRKAREKEEANRKAKEAMIEKKKAEALAKKKIEEEKKKKEEEAARKKAAQNQQLRASLTKKVKETQMDQKVKNKLLNQLKNYSIQIKNIAPSIQQTINSEKLNGNYNEEANRKKRQEVKKQLAAYIASTYPNMSKADRGKYIKRANLTQWKEWGFTGSSGMEANKALERIKGNMRKNMQEQARHEKEQEKAIATFTATTEFKTADTSNFFSKEKTRVISKINRNLQGQAHKNASRFKSLVKNSKNHKNLRMVESLLSSKVRQLKQRGYIK